MQLTSETMWEHARMIRLGLQFFAEGSGGDGGDGGAGSANDGSEAPEGAVQTNEGTTTDDSDFYAKMSQDDRKAFLKKHGLMHHKSAEARYKGSVDKAGKLDAMQGDLEALAKYYGVAADDPQAVIRAALNDPARVKAKAKELGTSEEVAAKYLGIETERDRLKREADQRVRAEEFARMSKEEETVKAAYPDFDRAEASKSPAFKAMVDAGIDMKTAYEAAFHTALSASAIEAAKVQAREEALAEYRANGSRPREGAGGAAPGSGTLSTDYKSMTKEQLRAAEKKYL